MQWKEQKFLTIPIYKPEKTKYTLVLTFKTLVYKYCELLGAICFKNAVKNLDLLNQNRLQ